MRIAWFTPFNPHSAIGHYSEAVVAGLAGTDEVVLYASDAPRAAHVGPVRVVALEDERPDAVAHELKGFDAVVYNMGNHMPYHKRIYEVLLRRPAWWSCTIWSCATSSSATSCRRSGRRSSWPGRWPTARGRRPRPWPVPSSSATTPRSSTTPSACATRCSRRSCTAARASSSIRSTAAPASPPSSPPRSKSSTSRPSGRPRTAASARNTNPRPRPAPRALARSACSTFGVLVANKQVHAVLVAIAASDFLRRHVEYTVVGDGDPDYVRRLLRRRSTDSAWRAASA